MVFKGRLYTRDRLCRFGMGVDDSCVLCEVCTESMAHLFFQCSFVQQVIRLINQELMIGWRVRSWEECQAWIASNAQGKSRKARNLRGIFYSAIQGVWWKRNRRIFANIRSDYIITAHRVLYLYRTYSA
ncbi:hypothetical protein Dimus_038550 [Dionaea muscipula]